ncbi:uncharacterized protein BX664DRAFT_184383 [Halteromyces radiatus]|uniref:uncharacterized protein n=1 Tax=Halteromyces radiatus TaxID=101107 RepID=UPI00221E7021|nr:uncharacterized protein BX664DRAFT_184383 [Halteromyces radiatus]KAI8082844.1 hypothetical protein BX664DRAFT_184383 [Halteromyces radiatus]
MTTITASPKQLSSLPSNQRRTRSMGKIYSKEQDNPEETNNNNKRPTPSYCTKTEEFSVSINSPSKKRRTSQTPAAAKKVVDTFNQEVSNPIVSPVNQVTYKSDEDTNDDIEETDDNISNNIDDPYDNKDISSSYDLNDEQLSPPSPSPSAAFLRQREGFVGNSRHNYLSSPTADVSMTGINTSEVYGYMNGDEDEDKDGTHYSEFGWPDMDPTATHDANNNSNSTNNISCGRRNSNHLNSSEEFFSIQGNNHQQHQHSTSFFSDRPLQRSLLQDFLQADDYVQGDGGDSEQPISGQQPIDEVDMFFSASQADYVSMSFSTKLSIPQQRQQFLALAKPTYLTSWPHFLTLDYFDTHDAHDRSDIVPPSPPPSSNHQENSDNGNDTMTPILSTASYFDTKFSVLHRIGTGEYADVWKVWNIESNEVFAIKKLKVPFQSFSDR